MDGMDSRSARRRRRHAARLCSAVAIGCTFLIPAVADAGVGASAVPTFPTSVIVGQTGLGATIEVVNLNSAPDDQGAAALNTVCNAGDAFPCPGGQPGITLTPSCSALTNDADCASAGADPGVFAIANSGTGVPGTSCAGMAFTITQIPGEFGQLRFTPVSNQHVQLLGRGTLCRVAFTFDVVRAPQADVSPTPGVQTAQIVENLQWGGVQATTAFARGSSVGTTVQRAQPAIATQASASVEVGGQLTDTAVVSGRVNPVNGATVDFRLYGPDDASCAGTPIFQSLARPVDGAGRAVSDPYVPAAPGTYRWIAAYSGDANNEPVTGRCNDANENVIVTPPTTNTSGGPPTARPPRITVSDVPGQGGRCTGSNFKLRVNTRAAGLKSVRVTLDGKTIATSKKAKFSIRVHAKAKKFGRHVIRIIANGKGGRTVRVLEFRRCGRPVQPRFVG